MSKRHDCTPDDDEGGNPLDTRSRREDMAVHLVDVLLSGELEPAAAEQILDALRFLEGPARK